MSFAMSEISIFACIKGCHSYKITPKDSSALVVQPEKKNKFDANALSVLSNNELIGHVPARPVPLQICLGKLLQRYTISW
jgi:hypothetical protein